MYEEQYDSVAIPKVGDAVTVIIRPSVRSDRRWFQVGKLLATRCEPFGLIVGAVEVTGELAAEDVPQGALSDTTWIGGVVAAVHNRYDGAWHATQPVCAKAKAAWCRAWRAELANGAPPALPDGCSNEEGRTG